MGYPLDVGLLDCIGLGASECECVEVRNWGEANKFGNGNFTASRGKRGRSKGTKQYHTGRSWQPPLLEAYCI